MSEDPKCCCGEDEGVRDDGKGPVHAPYLKPGILRSVTMAGATGLGTGLLPVAPGTFGTVLGVVLFWFMAPPPGSGMWLGYIAATLVFVLFAIEASTAAESVFRKRDDQRIVIDEVVGYMVTMFWVPRTWELALTGFVVFRILDIAKPGFVGRSQKLPYGRGVVADDVFAGLVACAIVHILRLVIP